MTMTKEEYTNAKNMVYVIEALALLLCAICIL